MPDIHALRDFCGGTAEEEPLPHVSSGDEVKLWVLFEILAPMGAVCPDTLAASDGLLLGLRSIVEIDILVYEN